MGEKSRMVNFVGELLDLTQRAEFNLILLWVVVAIAVTVLWGPKTLTREREGRSASVLQR